MTTDRPFWLEAYVGGPYTVDRRGRPDPLFIRRLAVATYGTMQPDKLAEALGSADDGLAGRFLWSWPEPGIFRRPGRGADAGAAAAALAKLADLTMPQDADGEPVPAYLSLTDAAAAALAAFGAEMQAREDGAHGLLKSTLGKARGQALRLALVLTFLRWCVGDDPEPTGVDELELTAASALMRDYFLPMAERVLGDASIPAEERNARTLATWIVQTRPATVNVSHIRDRARLAGLRETDGVKAACRFLADARWLVPADVSTGGRPRGDWTVNPDLWTTLA